MNGINPKWGMYLGLAVIIEQGIGHGTVSLTNLIPAGWAPYVTSWANFLAFVGTSIMTYQAAVSSPTSGPAINTSIAPAAKLAIFLAVTFALLSLAPSAHAQANLLPRIHLDRPAVTGDIKADIKTDLAKKGIAVPTVIAGAKCDFNIFAMLDAANVVTSVQNCVSDANKLFLPDVTAALASAVAFKDDTGAACLKPALAIVQAAVGTPEVVAVAAVPATATEPAIPAVVGVPAQLPGIILIFQKFREFTLAGGPTACQNWVKTTINGVNPL